ncbi:SAM hydrolase/SAM-dependent halogenase family protein [Desulfurococcus amylolyticus]|uniref:SAM-dependent chlorinase/fluorinase n=1 Tax=Desulfurococcus amylolyticus DSM 16532 TaxID=768672 RepID=I3XSP4_DESAM|nr:SAM-dependent chlorinase/fluorinase [Desulfurococcus amylolyticus]AFL66968.1 protein of unknown function DUF62 [Desulfurococcus amylolyticus DSM 16532]
MSNRIIALITDFGYRDPYVGVMKGVIKSINPGAEIVDLTHGINRHNIIEAAVVLMVSARYFPPSTIFVVVVDPGVGSNRRAIVVETSNYILVGPDNGCLSLLALKDGVKRVVDISNSRYRLGNVSHTFHGRDIFAPVAAWISRGIPLEAIGTEIPVDSLKTIRIEPPRISDDLIEGHALYIDIYGNVMTNISEDEAYSILRLGDKIEIIHQGGKSQCMFTTSFSIVNPGEVACYINSWGYLEIAVNNGSVADAFGIIQGSRLLFKKLP